MKNNPLKEGASTGNASILDLTGRQPAELTTLLFKAIVESSDDAIISKDLNSIITSWNKGAEKMFGYAASEIVGHSILRLIPPGQQAEETQILEKIKRGERVEHFETVRQTKGGRLVEISVTASPITDATGTVIGVSKVARDITGRKQTELHVQQLNRFYAALCSVNQAIIHAASPDTLCQKICRILVEQGQFKMAAVRWLDPPSQLILPKAIFGDETGYIKSINVYADDRPEGHGPSGISFREGRPYICNDFFADPITLPWRESAKLAGFNSMISLPVRQAGQAAGLLTVYANERNFFGAKEVALLEEAATDLSFALDILSNNIAHKRAEAQVKLQISALNSAANAIVITNTNGVIEFVNDAFTTMTGYSREEAVGQNPRVLKSGTHPLEFYQQLWATVKAGHVWHGELQNRRKDGSLYDEEMTITPVPGADGQMTHFIAIKQVITARKQAEAALRTAMAAAEQAARAKSEFLASMSHEIRTPMNGVIGMTGLLLETDLTREQRDFTNTIQISADNLLTIINEILDFSKIESGKLNMEVLDFNLREVVESTLELLAERAQAKGIELTNSVLPDVPTQLRGDSGRVRQILTNLVGNAIKFTTRGEVAIRVRKESETATHVRLHFEVKDTGIGIPLETQGRLFQAFIQADSSTTRKFGGTGLGLVISRKLVELMQGQIGVASAAGKGSTFWFTIELEKQSAEAKPPVKYSGDLIDLRVLVVDDNATNRQILRDQIFAWKMQNGSAASGREALDLLTTAAAAGIPYELALLDMQMPEMDGLTLARLIKANPAIASTRLIILTSLGQRPDAAELKAAGVDAYLVKPVKQSRLFNCLIEVMSTVRVEETARGAMPLVSRKGSAISPQAVPTRKMRILLAEDNHINQKVALGQLHRLGYTADTVADGLEVLTALQSIPYDVVLLDCQMPELDGYETARLIRQHEREVLSTHPHPAPLHIIAMTANAVQGDREKCLAAGMDDYISKPVQTSELLAALERWQPVTLNPAGRAGASLLPTEAPVDLERLREMAGDQPEFVQSLVDLYLAQADELAKELKVAIQAKSASDVAHLAHKLCGSSLTCGMTGIAAPLRKLEAMGNAGRSPENDELLEEVNQQLDRIRQFLATHIQSVTKP